MFGNNDYVGQRVKGETLPMSVPTALAVERACGVHPEIKDPSPPIHAYRMILINVKTMIRNLHSSIEPDGLKRPDYDDLLSGLVEDMRITESAIIDASKGSSQVQFYLPTYHSIKRQFPRAKLKLPSTEKQRQYADFEKNMVLGFKKQIRQGIPLEVESTDMGPEGRYPKSLVVTHYPVDLLQRSRFTEMMLLESHTGKMKGSGQWNSKLTGSKGMERIPFTKFTLQLFGDATHFLSMPHKYKKEVLQIAEQERWTSTTSKERMLQGIKKISDAEVRGRILELMG